MKLDTYRPEDDMTSEFGSATPSKFTLHTTKFFHPADLKLPSPDTAMKIIIYRLEDDIMNESGSGTRSKFIHYHYTNLISKSYFLTEGSKILKNPVRQFCRILIFFGQEIHNNLIF